jgi:hypothetical protein
MKIWIFRILSFIFFAACFWWIGAALFISTTDCDTILFSLDYKKPGFCDPIEKAILPASVLISMVVTVLLFKGKR